MKKLKVAIVHDYLVQYGGAEKTLEAIIELFPDADIYTGSYNKKNLSQEITSKKIIYPKNPMFSVFPKYLTFLMPLVFERFDLRKYDLIISEGTAWAKGVLSTPNQVHISYIHTPPRFLYKYSVESAKRDKWYFKPLVPVIDHFLRVWDFYAAQRPDVLIANSKEVQKRIHKFYKRDSYLVYPPVEMETQYSKNNLPFNPNEKYYLSLGRLSKYKNTDLLIQAFNMTEMKLIVAGTGVEFSKLKKMARSNIQFLGRVDQNTKKALYANCEGLIFPVEDEDFGITPIEANSFGKPVLAHRSGGPLETITEGVNGMFFEKLTIEELIRAIKEFDDKISKGHYDSAAIAEKAKIYQKSTFQKNFFDLVKKQTKHARIA